MSKKIKDWFMTDFMKGFTIFHLVGFVLMVLGGNFGQQQSHAGFNYTLPQLAGFLTFFWKVIEKVAVVFSNVLGMKIADRVK